MLIPLKRLSPSYLDPKKVHLRSEVIITLRGKSENRILCFLTLSQKLSNPAVQLLFLISLALPITQSPTHHTICRSKHSQRCIPPHPQPCSSSNCPQWWMYPSCGETHISKYWNQSNELIVIVFGMTSEDTGFISELPIVWLEQINFCKPAFPHP